MPLGMRLVDLSQKDSSNQSHVKTAGRQNESKYIILITKYPKMSCGSVNRVIDNGIGTTDSTML